MLVVNNYRYHRHTNRVTSIHWRCWRPRCQAKVQTNVFDQDDANARIRVLRAASPRDHNHQDDQDQIRNDRFRGDLQAEVRRDPTLPARRQYTVGVARDQRNRRQGGGDIAPVAGFNSVRSTLQRTRRESLPPIPQTTDEVIIEGTWAETWNGDRFQQFRDDNTVILATDENLRRLQECNTVYMDATFRSCPRPYTQFFTVVGEVHGFAVPLVQVLMADKRAAAYENVFAAISRAVRRCTHRRLAPTKIICDFELALHQAVENAFPTANICGCYFHFTQSLWRKIQRFGLTGAVQRRARLKDLVGKVLAIGYLPTPVVRLNFNNLVASRRTRQLIQRFPQLANWLAYVRNTYIRPGATFPVRIWNVYQRDMATRTNNQVECEYIFVILTASNFLPI